MARIKALDLVHTGPSVFGKGIDVHFALGECETHADGCVA
jgi:uncharacterized Fe-S cluster protein YjdI